MLLSRKAQSSQWTVRLIQRKHAKRVVSVFAKETKESGEVHLRVERRKDDWMQMVG